LLFKSERPTLAKLVTYYMRSGKLSLRGDLSDTLIAFVTYTLTYLLWEETTSFRKSVDAHTHTHTHTIHRQTGKEGRRDGRYLHASVMLSWSVVMATRSLSVRNAKLCWL